MAVAFMLAISCAVSSRWNLAGMPAHSCFMVMVVLMITQ
jgi:hypothetical protein